MDITFLISYLSPWCHISSHTWLTLHRTALQHFSLLTHWTCSVWMQNVSCHMSEQKMWPSSHQPLQLPPAVHLRGSRIETSRILALENDNAYQRNDFTEPRLLHLPRHTKPPNSYPVISSWHCSGYLVVAKLLYILLSSLPLWGVPLRDLSNFLLGLSPQKIHQIGDTF